MHVYSHPWQLRPTAGFHLPFHREPGDKSKAWLYNMSCGNDPQNLYHILRCKHDVGYDSLSKCSSSVGVSCCKCTVYYNQSSTPLGQPHPPGFSRFFNVAHWKTGRSLGAKATAGVPLWYLRLKTGGWSAKLPLQHIEHIPLQCRSLLCLTTAMKLWTLLRVVTLILVNFSLHAPTFETANEVLAEPHGYIGQVYLCPPDSFYSLNRSVSMGLVMLYLHDAWRTINLKPQGHISDLMDSLCRQLGFSRAVTNSGTARSGSRYSFEYCYHARPYA